MVPLLPHGELISPSEILPLESLEHLVNIPLKLRNLIRRRGHPDNLLGLLEFLCGFNMTVPFHELSALPEELHNPDPTVVLHNLRIGVLLFQNVAGVQNCDLEVIE